MERGENTMLEKIKSRIVNASKDTIAETVKEYSKEIFAVSSLALLVYLCIKVNGKPVNITVNVNGGAPWMIK